jgi:hypothetical protein
MHEKFIKLNSFCQKIDGRRDGFAMSEVFKEWLLSALMDLRSVEKIMDDK